MTIPILTEEKYIASVAALLGALIGAMAAIFGNILVQRAQRKQWMRDSRRVAYAAVLESALEIQANLDENAEIQTISGELREFGLTLSKGLLLADVGMTLFLKGLGRVHPNRYTRTLDSWSRARC